ncbi:MAG: acyltransferase family protein [Micropruina sp.]|uniref:acyltransferase n=1 Tax=Micropruina sp. TaxID=2737536 RepID=UPI0039E53599
MARLAYVDRLRVAAAAAVVMVHVAAMAWNDIPPASADWQAINVYGSLSRWCVPIFFMISGVLFLAPGRQDAPKRIWTHYILRLLVMYVFWSAAYAAANATFESKWNLDFLARQFWEGYYHLWYLPAMAGVYALIPLLQQIATSPVLTRYLLVLIGTASVLLPTVALIPVAGHLSTDLVARVAPFLVAGFPFYFVLGHVLHEHRAELPSWVRPASYVGAVLGAAVIIGMTSWLSVARNEPVNGIYNYLFLGVVLMSVAVFLLFIDRSDEATTSPRLAVIARWTLPIYLIHPAFVRLTEEINLSPGLLPTAVGIPLIWIGVLAVSALASAILVRIPFVNSWLV